ncbi:sulfoxide reductase heme-binding subunit YedZ [Nicoletella semolina]|uniref:Protein-methionine-sulfoxide reductase heme-binding subunit MsrQ n=1 Tax=Nicoletella semolina TaxID=271160 RepID=A0A4V2SJR9_9PAST|nr:protein-methionine-sulfoxide reductase heme-binding subunit MsrQ [Nicoletella semolina]MDH2924720.1 sulfoxide reductase heme-binding subunit YedZ [Nicoletella semolina]TCP16656.1 sulfoxide reductase heme-binding subunit YedZ [Nicoletella semolina]
MTVFRLVIHFGCSVPLIWLTWVLAQDDVAALGADPIKELQHFLGYGAILIFSLMFLLGILLQLWQKNAYQILRRPLGLWAFFWAFLHMLSYFLLELGQDIALFGSELINRPYLILGAVALFILTMMAITSLPNIKRWLGSRWFNLHQLAYPALILATIHYYWSVKSLTLSPVIMILLTSFITAWRLWKKR